MNKEQKALDWLYEQARYYCVDGDCRPNENANVLQELINKWDRLGCELGNLPYLDDECKLLTLTQIVRIYYDK